MSRRQASGLPTLNDVAKLAGVSYQTVSRVINRLPNVAPETLQRVNAAIAQLNYSPNPAARSLVTGRTKVIHVLGFDYFNLRMIPSMEREASARGFQLRISTVHEATTLPEISHKLASFTSSQVDGIVLVLPWSTLPYPSLVELCSGVPLVILGCSLGTETNSVLIDQRLGTRQLVQHLLEMGHNRIAEICGPVDKYDDAKIRHRALREMLSEHGLSPTDSLQSDFTMDGGFRAMNALIARNTDSSFTAVVCANDEIALGAMHAAQLVGIRVPDQLSIVGFDDQDFAAFCCPTLTTIRQDIRELGKQSIQQLLSIIEHPETVPHHRVLLPKLVVRGSTAAPSPRSRLK